MKPTSEQKQPLEDSKEGLHTQGEWRLEKYGRSMFGKVIVSEVDGGQQKICILDFGYMTTLEEAEANAELIVKCVNERKALLDALKDTLMLAEELKFESEKAYQICETAEKLINNAKNI